MLLLNLEANFWGITIFGIRIADLGKRHCLQLYSYNSGYLKTFVYQQLFSYIVINIASHNFGSFFSTCNGPPYFTKTDNNTLRLCLVQFKIFRIVLINTSLFGCTLRILRRRITVQTSPNYAILHTAQYDPYNRVYTTHQYSSFIHSF